MKKVILFCALLLACVGIQAQTEKEQNNVDQTELILPDIAADVVMGDFTVLSDDFVSNNSYLAIGDGSYTTTLALGEVEVSEIINLDYGGHLVDVDISTPLMDAILYDGYIRKAHEPTTKTPVKYIEKSIPYFKGYNRSQYKPPTI